MAPGHSHARGLQTRQTDVALDGRLVHAEHGRPHEQRAEEQVPEVVPATCDMTCEAVSQELSPVK